MAFRKKLKTQPYLVIVKLPRNEPKRCLNRKTRKSIVEKDKSINKKSGKKSHTFDHKRDPVEPEIISIKDRLFRLKLFKNNNNIQYNSVIYFRSFKILYSSYCNFNYTICMCKLHIVSTILAPPLCR